MKRIFSYISALSLALIFNACESDLDTVTYNGEGAKPAVLSALSGPYVLDAQKAEEVVFTLNWTEPDMGYQAAVTNNIEMDIAGNNFSKAVVVASLGKGGKQELTHAGLNSSLLKYLEDNEMEIAPVDVEFRVASSVSSAAKAVYSGVATANITPFVGEREYPKIWVIGDYCGWNHGNSQFIYSANEDDNYAGMIYFDGKAANGWKFTPAAAWDAEWAAEGTPAAESPTLTLVPSGGGNITAYSHTSYYFEFDKSTALLKVSKAHNSWGVVGVHNSWGDNPDIVMTLSTEVDKAGNTQHFLVATLDLEANAGWKIRPDNTWTDDVGPSAVEGTFVDNGDGNFRVDEPGNYTIKWYFNKVKQQLVVTKN